MALSSTLARWFGAGGQAAPALLAKAADAWAQRKALANQAVCEAMSAAGVPSSSYKRDIQWVSEQGSQVRVNLDLSGELAGLNVGNLAQYGAVIAKRVLGLSGFEVTGVYWRLNPLAAPVGGEWPAAPAATDHPSAESAAQRLASMHAQVPDNPFEDSASPDFAKTVLGEMIDLHSVRRK